MTALYSDAGYAGIRAVSLLRDVPVQGKTVPKKGNQSERIEKHFDLI
ncbi:hypothetical protein [Ruegeria sp. HKCCD8929]|nr:hypothetical protein [Ruegeria sp. HKCCD8929]